MRAKRKTADHTSVRAHNLSIVLNLIRQAGAVSRASISRQTQLSPTTISSLTGVLLDSGFVAESGTGRSSGGRPPILLQFNYNFRYVIGVDMGATHLALVVMDLQGLVVARAFRKLDVAGQPDQATAAIVDMASQAMGQSKLAPAVILGMGLAVPAPLEGENLNRLSPNILPAWADYDLIGEMNRCFDFPIYVDNDANAGALAEKWWGVGQKSANLAFIKLGTGVGSGLIVQNNIYRGDGGAAGEIGHTTIDAKGPLCRCGNRGCLEGFVGAQALIGRVNSRRPPGAPLLMSIEDIIDAARAGDEASRDALQTAGAYLGIAIANLLNLFNPGLVILGGELAIAGDLLLEEVLTAVNNRAMPKAAQEAEIIFSTLGQEAVAMGAATLAIQSAFAPAHLSRLLLP